MAGIDGGDGGLKLLPVTAGVQGVANIIMAKDGKGCDGITDPIIGPSEGLQTDEIIRGSGQALIADIGDISHAAKAHIGPPGDQASGNRTVVCLLFGIASQDVIEGVHEVAVLIDEMQYRADVHLFESIENGMVDRLTAAGIGQGPADLRAMLFNLEMVVVTGGDPLIDLDQAGF